MTGLRVLSTACDISYFMPQDPTTTTLEQALRQIAVLQRGNEALQATINALAEVAGAKDMVPRVLGIVAETFGTNSCAVYANAPDGLIRMRYWYKDGETLGAEQMAKLDEEKFGIVRGLARGFRVPTEYLGIPADEPGTVILNHLTGTAVAEFDRFAVSAGWELELNVGVGQRGVRANTLCVYRSHTRPYSSDEIVLAEVLARQVSLAMEYARLAEEARAAAMSEARAVELAQASAALQRTIDALSWIESLDDFIPEALRIVVEAFGARSAGFFECREERIFLRYWLHGGIVQGPVELSADLSGHRDLIMKMAAGFTVPQEYLGIDVRQRRLPAILHHSTMTVIPEFHAFALSMGWEWELNVPLLVDGRADGALTLYRGRDQPFTAAEFPLAETLCKQIALAMRISHVAVKERERVAAGQKAAILGEANEVLRRSVDRVADTRDIRLLVAAFLDEATRTLGADWGTIWQLLATEPKGFRVVAAVQDGEALGERDLAQDYWSDDYGEPVALDPTKFFRQIVAGSVPPIIVNPIADLDPECQAYHAARGHQLFLHAPLCARDQPIGYAAFAFRSVQIDEATIRQTVVAVATQLALALKLSDVAENAREAAIGFEREKSARERAEELVRANLVLKQTLEVVASEADLRKVLGHVLRAITQQLDSPSSALWLFNQDTGRFAVHVVFQAGNLVEVLPAAGAGLPADWGLGRDLAWKDHIRERRPVVYDVAGLGDTDPAAQRFFQRLGFSKLLGIPLMIGDETIGSITVRFPPGSEPDARDIALSEAMAYQATMAIQLTRLGEQASLTAVSAERTRFARDVHDTLAQGFTGILLQLGAISQVPDMDRGQMAQHLEAITGLARTSLAEARRSVSLLRQLPVVEIPFEHRLRQLVERFRQRSPVPVDFSAEGPISSLPMVVQRELLMIAQEALTNALKHSRCETLKVTAEGGPPAALRMSITDDGIGFDTSTEGSDQSFGLLGMQERAALIGASLTIISERGRGTEVVVQYSGAGRRS